MEQTLYKEACMNNVAGVVLICWIPADLDQLNHPDKKDPVTGKLRGKYVFKVQALDKLVKNDYANCPTFKVHPDIDWVEKKNIKAPYLATAQRTACDMSEWIWPAGQKYDEQGFVDVSCLNLTIPLEDDPINRMKYIPPKFDKDNIKINPEQRYGFSKRSKKKEAL